MKEYIERDAILGHKRKMRGFDLCEEFWDEAVLCEVIEKLPVADVAPVVHGEWIANRGGPFILGHECSLCGYYDEQVSNRLNPTPYCPKCGAKMDGGNK